MDYAFGHFMTDKNAPEIVHQYRTRYSEINTSKGNHIIAISVICADTEDEANRLAMSPFLSKIRQEKQIDDHRVPSLETTRHYPFSDEERDKIEKMKTNMIIGNPEQLKTQEEQLQQAYTADEII